MDLHPHQREIIKQIKNGSVLNGGVGSGKTHAAIAYYVEVVCGGSLKREFPMAHPVDLIVITTAKKRNALDWQTTALECGIFTDPEVSYGGVNFTVDSWNQVKKYVDVENAFFVWDEQRASGAGVWVKSFLKIVKKNQWIMLTATPADTWMDYIPLFIAHGYYRNRSHFIEQHVIWSWHGKYRKIRGYFGKRILEKHRDSILVPMPYERHTTRHLVAEPVAYVVDEFNMVWKKLWNVYTDEPLIDVAEKHRIARRVVNSDPSRLKAIGELSRKHPRMIIFYTFDYELDLLRTLMTELDIPVAEWNGHRHEPVPGTDRWLYLVQYQAGAEAWNCTTTDVVVFYSLTYSHRLFEQSQGRIDRMDTPYEDLWYYILMSESKIDQLIWKSLVNKKDFHEERNRKFKTIKE